MAKFVWNDKSLGGAADKAAKKVAAEVLATATAIAPHDTGTLARSLTSRLVYAAKERARYEVGTNVFYAPFVEFGTRFMAAQPYLGPALEQARRKYGGR